MFNKYICVKQHDYKDCGVACLATVCAHYGLKIPIATIREMADTDLTGTTVYGIVKAANKLKLKARAVKVDDYNDIFDEFTKPAIAHVVTNNNTMHYVVIHKVDKDKIIVADPAEGIVTYNTEEFWEIWTGIIIILEPSSYFDVGDKTKGIYRKFFKAITNQKKMFISIVIASILTTILGMGGGFYFKILMDDVLPLNSKKSIGVLAVTMIGLGIFKVLMEFSRNILTMHMSNNIDVSILMGYYKHVINLPMNFFRRRQVGELTSRFADAINIREALSTASLTILIDTGMAIGGAVLLFSQNSLLFKLSFIPLIIYVFFIFVFKKPLEDGNKSFMENNSEFSSYLIESFQGVETIKTFNMENRTIREAESKFFKYINSLFKYNYAINIQSALKTSVQTIFSISVVWVGATLLISGQISIGVLLSFNILLMYFIGPIERLINLQPTIQSAVVAANRLGEILEIDLEKSADEEKKISLKDLKGDIDFKNVGFRYGSKSKVLSSLNLSIKSGEKIALVGASGSGKTTIARLLMSFYNVEEGEILIDNNNIMDLNKEYLRENIGYLSQDSFFFSGTIKDNLLFACPNASSEEIIEACYKANIDKVIDELPLRYETHLEENASNLSAGQRQRLAIARVLLRKPKILIMDEATSNLDSITEKDIGKTIEECTKNATTILIAHRLSTITNCDRIYVLEKGQVVESGTHTELINEKGEYYKLWNK